MKKTFIVVWSLLLWLSAVGSLSVFAATAGQGQDQQAPTKPADVIAAPLNKSIDLSWEPSKDNVKVTGYRIYLDGKLEQTVQTTQATVEDLKNGTEYKVAVSAIDAAGNESGKYTVKESPRNLLPYLLIIFVCIAYIYNKVFRVEKLTFRQSVRKHLQAIKKGQWTVPGRSFLIYFLILIGSYMLLFFQEMGLPIIPSLLIAIGLMLIVRIRYWVQERGQRAGGQ